MLQEEQIVLEHSRVGMASTASSMLSEKKGTVIGVIGRGVMNSYCHVRRHYISSKNTTKMIKAQYVLLVLKLERYNLLILPGQCFVHPIVISWTSLVWFEKFYDC